jgi:hypothetical protein
VWCIFEYAWSGAKSLSLGALSAYRMQIATSDEERRSANHGRCCVSIFHRSDARRHIANDRRGNGVCRAERLDDGAGRSHSAPSAPRQDVVITVADVVGSSADEVVLSAWRLVHPDFQRVVKVVEDKPARLGWTQRREYIYETTPSERRSLYAVALQKGASWTAVLVEGTDAALEQRLGQVRLEWDGIRPRVFFLSLSPERLPTSWTRPAFERYRILE